MLNERAQEIKLPDKIYFRIGEVSEYTGIKPYVLRYWETEFPEIKPIRRKSQRLYDRETIYLIMKIKHMLYEQNYTIAGGKKEAQRGDEPKTCNNKGKRVAKRNPYRAKIYSIHKENRVI
ncbi:MAG: MerR family transcriptional regulator [Deltaproteobacteria bacterium]|nr:MAG: MerR family transcriptional regulator [Deltaproteobacteria bacterium]